MKLLWADFKTIIDAKSIAIQVDSRPEVYYLKSFDGPMLYETSVLKNGGADQTEFEADYLPTANGVASKTEVRQADPDTLGLSTTPKWAPQGWSQVYHEFEFKTSQLNAIHDKGVDGLDKGFTTAKFFKANGDEITTQGALDTDCVRTEITFMPNHDYAIKSGMVAQITSPSEAVYLWALAPLSELGMADKVFCDGGINLEFVDSKNLVGLDGTAATMMPYMGGVGANRIRFIVRHSAGFKHRVQCILEYFKA